MPSGSACRVGGNHRHRPFGEKKVELLRRFRPFRDGAPSHDHLGDILATLDAEQFQRCFLAWVASPFVGSCELRLVNRQLADAERQLDKLCKKLAEPVGGEDGESVPGQRQEHRDVTILDSLPGVGRIILATMLAEASEALQRRDYHALRNLCGSAPVTRRSGKSCIVMRRRAFNRRLSNAVFNWGRTAIQNDATSRAKYDALRARGHGHARAIRSVVDRLLYVACALLENGTLFDPSLAKKENAAA